MAKRKISDFIVIDELVNDGVKVSGGSTIDQVEVGEKGKLAKLTMMIDNEAAQKLMSSLAHGTQEYIALVFVVPHNEFIVKKNNLENSPTLEELSFEAGRERIKHPDWDFVYETFADYKARKVGS